MITRPTVLVLGAGVSHEYGFPTGGQLVDRLANGPGVQEANEIGLIREYSTAVGIARRVVRTSVDVAHSFSVALRESGSGSIDEFLLKRPEFGDIGRAAIASDLISFESRNALFRHASADSLYRNLRHELLGESRDDIRRNRLTVVTLNYDRSLETYLHAAIVNSYGLADSDAQEFLSAIKFVRPHGSLGHLPGSGQDRAREYTTDCGDTEVSIASRSIVLLHEQDTSLAGYDSAKRVIDEAEQVCFLGFGYHAEVLRRLDFPIIARNKRVTGTNVGLSQRRETTARNEFSIDLQTGLKHMNSLQHLQWAGLL